MHGLLDKPVVLLAWALACGLVLLGVRTAFLGPNPPKSLFFSALSFFLLLGGVAAGGCSAPATSGPGPTGQNETAGDADPGEEPIVSRPTKAGAALPLPPELAGNKWNAFKTLWRSLDRVDPPATAKGPGGVYSMAITPDEQNLFRTKLAQTFGMDSSEQLAIQVMPFEEGTLSPLSRVLATLALERIEHMGLDPAFLTRMMPPQSAQLHPLVIDDLEQRIDTLIELAEQDQIDSQTYRLGLQKVQNDAYLSAVLSLVERTGSYFSPVPTGSGSNADPQLRWSPEAWMDAFDQAHSKAGSSKAASPQVSQSHEVIKRRLAELKAVEPELAELIEDLAQ